jgi:hypothetical protein
MTKEITPYTAWYSIDVTVDGKHAITLEVGPADWGRKDLYEAVLKPQIEEWGAYPGRDKIERAAVKKAVKHLCEQWTLTPPKGAPERPVEATYETNVWGPRTYGELPLSEVPATWKNQPLSTAVNKDPQIEAEVVSSVEELLWPIPDSVATINTTDPWVVPENECLWGRAELIAALWRFQRELETRSAGKPYYGNLEDKNKIAINSAYRRSGVTAKGDPKGARDRGKDAAGHWTGYTVDLGRGETSKRFGIAGNLEERQGEVNDAAIAAGFNPWVGGEPWHYQVRAEYRFE